MAFYTSKLVLSRTTVRSMRLVWDQIMLWWGLVYWDCLTWLSGKPSSCVSRTKLTHSSSFRGQSSQVLTLSRGTTFIAWRLRCLSLGECRRELRYFYARQACLGYGSVPGPTSKMPCATFACLVGCATNKCTRKLVQHYHMIIFLVSMTEFFSFCAGECIAFLHWANWFFFLFRTR